MTLVNCDLAEKIACSFIETQPELNTMLFIEIPRQVPVGQ